MCTHCGAKAVQTTAEDWWCTSCWQGSGTEPLMQMIGTVGQVSETPDLLSLIALSMTRHFHHSRRTEFFRHLESLEIAHRLNFASAWKGSEAELQAIRKVEPSGKLNAFHRWLNRWLRELTRLRGQIAESVAKMPEIYGIAGGDRRAWIAEASEFLWTRLGRPYRTWIIAATFSPGSMIAPSWLSISIDPLFNAGGLAVPTKS